MAIMAVFNLKNLMSLVSDKTDGKAVARVKEEQKNQDQAPYIFCALSVYGFYRTGANC